MQAIASQLWGDASMWYLIADANGLTGQEPLPEGMSLTVPNKVTNIHNNSSTFQVYNAGEAIGDTMPTLPDAPPPPADKGGGGCGGIAKILVIVIAIVATVLTAGAAAVAMGMVQGATLATATLGGMMSAGVGVLGGSLGLAGAAAAAIGGAVGSILSQGAAMAMGVQDKFSWSGVAMSAVGAGVGAGLGNPAGASTLATVGRAAASNAITQGIAVATGLQKKFDLRGVAASALGAGVGHGVGKALKDTNWLVKGTAIGMANGGVQAAVTGQQPNWGAIAAGSFASTMGNGIAESLADGTFGNPMGNSIVDSIGGPSQSELELQRQEGARDAGAFAALDDMPALGSGLKVRADIWGSTKNYGNLPLTDLSLTANGVPNLPTIEASGPTAGQMEEMAAALRQPYLDQEFMPVAGLKDELVRGYRDPYGRMRSVMDNPETTGETIGRYAGQAVDSFKRFGAGITGVTSMNAAQANWQAGNYGSALLHGMQAVGEAGMTALSFGTGSTLRTGAGMTVEQLTATRATYTVDVTTADAAALRRAYLNEKFGRTGDLNLDINIRGRQEMATNFFQSQGIPEGSIPSYLTGIDFTQPVTLQTFGSGKRLWQYQTPGAPQGNWYSFSSSVQPTELGISPFGFNRATQAVEPKVLNSYATSEPATMLRSTSASVNDFWSVKGQSYPTIGGARQLFSTQKSAFELQK